MRASILTIALAAAVLACLPQARAEATNEVNLYSYRQPFLIQPLLDKFTSETGIKVNVVFAQKGVLERIKAEGRNSPADLVLTVDIGRLNDMVEADVLQPIQSQVLNENIPDQYRHPKGLWFGLTARARVVIASKDRVEPGSIKTYEDLADPRFEGRICTRSGKHVYNVSLIASMVTHHGEAATEEWLAGVKKNLARKPQGNDRAQAKAIHEGICDIGIVNTYYMGLMATNDKEPQQRAWADSVRVIFPNQDDRGTHVNVSGAGVLKGANNHENAVKLLEFLSRGEAQGIYAERNFEYPVKPGVDLHPLVASWGDFKKDTVNLAKVAEHRATASKIVDRVGYDR